MAADQDPFRRRLLRRRAPTLREWCAYWLDTDTAKRPKSRKEDASTLTLHVYPELGDTRIDAITRHDVQLLVARWAANAMPRTVHRRYAVLRAALNAAIDAELLDRSPCRRIRMPASAPAVAHALTPEEVTRLARETGKRYAPMIFTAAMLGLRFCECAALRVGRIDLERGRISIEEGLVEAEGGRLYSNPPKSSAGRRTMCMPGSLIAMLDSHLDAVAINRDDEQALVFTSPTGGPLRYSNFRKRVWYPAVARTGLPSIGFHDLRRTAATILVASRIDMKTAQVRLGHANPALTLKIYAQATTEQDHAAAATIDSYFARVLGPESSGHDVSRVSAASAGGVSARVSSESVGYPGTRPDSFDIGGETSMSALDGMKVAFLVANEGVEQVELTEPWNAVEAAGGQPVLVAPDAGTVQAFNHLDRGDSFPVDLAVGDASADDFVGLVLPGGVANADQLRMKGDAVAFAKRFVDTGRPVAVICHGPWTLVEADVVRNRTLTSWPSVKTDIVNAGGHWVDEEVKVCRGDENVIVSSRKPDDLPAFCRAFIDVFDEYATKTRAA